MSGITNPHPGGLDRQIRLQHYRIMLTARLLDAKEEELIQRGEAFFHVSGAGHEAVATLADHLGPQDWLHAHYRDKALLLARGMTVGDFLLSLLCKDGSHSRGRQMSAHMSDPKRNVLSMAGPVGNHALQAVGVAEAVKAQADQPIVLCAMGDGTTQQGEVLEAIAHAVRKSLPVLFLIEDNRLSISTETQEGNPLTMLEALRSALEHHLERDLRVELLGEDIADPKGDVFGLTRGLSTRFPDRVENAPLAEATIIGLSVGRALAGKRPLAFLQFAAEALAGAGYLADIIDLRSLSPWDDQAVVESVRKTRRLIVVHEDNHTCGFGAEIVATVAEQLDNQAQLRRVTRADTHVPCNFANQLEVLPSFRRTLEAAAELLELDLTWQARPAAVAGETIIEASGSSPSDESVVVVGWMIREGQRIEVGDEIALLEADKALLEFASPAAGTVKKRMAQEGDRVRIGDP